MEGKTARFSSKVVFAVGLLTSLFILYSIGFRRFSTMVQMGIPLMGICILTFFVKPLPEKIRKIKFLNVLNLLLFCLGLLAIGYNTFFFNEIAQRMGNPTSLYVAASLFILLIVWEYSRRMAGLPLSLVALAFLLYAYLGPYMPGFMAHQGYSFSRILRYMSISQEGIYGIALSAVFDVIFIYVIFSSFLEKLGGGKFFTDLAFGLVGRLSSGPAQVAVVASSFFGTISGSAVANVVVDGWLTIPMMKKLGYKPHFAAAVEATASTGGQIMPPVMGIGAFIMADITGIPYIKICAAAAIPAILYYLSLAFTVHMEARKLGFKPVKREDLPKTLETLKQGAHFLITIFALLFFMVIGYSPEGSCFWAIIVMIIVKALRDRRQVSLKYFKENIIAPLAHGAQSAIMVLLACACVGIVIGSVTMTGLGSAFSELVAKTAEIHLLVALVCIMIASLILGMGLPTTAAYLILVIVTAPALADVGVPLLSAHLFVFYFGAMSAITPPVALAAYAAAGIGECDPFRTGFTATRLAIVGFIVPFMFIFGKPLILIGSPIEIILAAITATLGVFTLSIGSVGYFIKKVNVPERMLILIGAFCLIKPGYITDLIGLVLVAFVLGRQIAPAIRLKKMRELA